MSACTSRTGKWRRRQPDERHGGRAGGIHDEVDSSSAEMARFGGNLEW
jgi:hypothetical protein